MSDKIRAGLWRCTSGFFATVNGVQKAIHHGVIVPIQAPYSVMDGCERWFAAVEPAEAPVGPFAGLEAEVIEQATSAPGEKRTTRRPTPKPEDATDGAG